MSPARPLCGCGHRGCLESFAGRLPMAGQSDIYVARNVLANEFVRRKEFDAMVWIDSDIELV
jgi:predicted NBD/HSP70 family sugar kinase